MICNPKSQNRDLGHLALRKFEVLLSKRILILRQRIGSNSREFEMSATKSVRIAKIDVEPDDFEELVAAIVDGIGYTTAFFTNEHGSIFVPSGLGYTKVSDPIRSYDFRGKSRLLDAVAKCYRDARPEGGRFILNSEGAVRSDNGDLFVKWNKSVALIQFFATLPNGPRFSNYHEMLAHTLSTFR